jgi:hypothetical protein
MSAIKLSEAAAASLNITGNVPSPPRPAGVRFRGKRHKPGHMNRLEASYAEHLEMLRGIGAILWWAFEAVKLRLADKCFLTPDFCVMLKDGTLEMRDTKGFMEEDANIKLKVAAQLYPFGFVVVKKQAKKLGGGWEHRDVKAH